MMRAPNALALGTYLMLMRVTHHVIVDSVSRRKNAG